MLRPAVLLLVGICLGLSSAQLTEQAEKKRVICSRLAENDGLKVRKRDDGACAMNQFRCPHTGSCIQAEWTCDTEDDCGDNSDETLPECPPPGKCSGAHQVLCGNQRCVPIEYRCDGEDDCGDGSDEKGCSQFTCNEGEWKCDNGRCIEQVFRCDRTDDCRDGSDEHHCSSRGILVT